MKIQRTKETIEEIAERLISESDEYKTAGLTEYQNGRFNGIIEGAKYQTNIEEFEKCKTDPVYFYNTYTTAGIDNPITQEEFDLIMLLRIRPKRAILRPHFDKHGMLDGGDWFENGKLTGHIDPCGEDGVEGQPGK